MWESQGRDAWPVLRQLCQLHGCWMACISVWCGICYTPSAEVDFLLPSLPMIPVSLGKYPRMLTGISLHFLTPFQCDLCVFHCLMGRNPLQHNMLLQACIRQVNLDALWGRETTTIEASHCSVNKLLQLWASLGVPLNLPRVGPYSLDDTFGYGIAVAMVLKSRKPGCYAQYQQ
jgi:hypothetical protein